MFGTVVSFDYRSSSKVKVIDQSSRSQEETTALAITQSAWWMCNTAGGDGMTVCPTLTRTRVGDAAGLFAKAVGTISSEGYPTERTIRILFGNLKNA